jgi:selenocysteine lyase/cysteine desulfurase
MDGTLSAGLVCADVARAHAPEIVDGLREEHRIVANVTPYATEYVRFGPSVANSEEQVDQAIAAVAAMTEH